MYRTDSDCEGQEGTLSRLEYDFSGSGTWIASAKGSQHMLAPIRISTNGCSSNDVIGCNRQGVLKHASQCGRSLESCDDQQSSIRVWVVSGARKTDINIGLSCATTIALLTLQTFMNDVLLNIYSFIAISAALNTAVYNKYGAGLYGVPVAF
ncbi:hypothetical protein V1504DRAFT_471926 [Lipomyces starkeyi]